jgi:hypothetical protein
VWIGGRKRKLNTSIEAIETGTAYASPRRTATATTAMT